MYLGRFVQGNEIALRVVTVNGVGVASAPAGPAAVYVYNSSGTKLLSALMPSADKFLTTGLFVYRLYLDGTYSVGLYRVALCYSLAGVGFVQTGSFEVMEGGHAEGPPVSMVHFERPHAAFLVFRSEKGTRFLGRNPSL